MQRDKIITIAAVLITLFLFNTTVSARDFFQLPGVIHVHSTYSSGRYSIEELVAKAKEKNLEVLVLTDHDQVVMEYGLFPLRNLIKKREVRNSVLQAGPQRYLNEIRRLNEAQQSVLIIPGVQSSPFYFWKGDPLGQGLSAHNFRKELLLIGLFSPADYYGLPRLHGGFSTRYVKDLLPRFIVFLAVLLISVYLLLQKGKVRIGGLITAILSIALLVNHHPFKSSRFDAYHGDQGIAPYQDVIDYVDSRGGLVFWAHPESNYSKDGIRLGLIRMVTKPYPDDLIASENYTGFAALYGDSLRAADAGMQWDQILMNYCRGRRAHPVWAIGGSDFHEEQKGFDLATFQTIFLVENKRQEDVTQALKQGRIYAVRQASDIRLTLDQFQLLDKENGKMALMGEELNLKAAPIIEGRVAASDGGGYAVNVSIIKDGRQAWTFEGQTPLDFHLVDQDGRIGKSYYRLNVKGKATGHLLSNPIFVIRK
jgi:hypothetical protein